MWFQGEPISSGQAVAVVNWEVPSGGGAVYLTGTVEIDTPCKARVWIGSEDFTVGYDKVLDESAVLEEPENMHLAAWSVFTDVPAGTYTSYMYLEDNENSHSTVRVTLFALVAGSGSTGEPDVVLGGLQGDLCVEDAIVEGPSIDYFPETIEIEIEKEFRYCGSTEESVLYEWARSFHPLVRFTVFQWDGSFYVNAYVAGVDGLGEYVDNGYAFVSENVDALITDGWLGMHTVRAWITNSGTTGTLHCSVDGIEIGSTEFSTIDWLDIPEPAEENFTAYYRLLEQFPDMQDDVYRQWVKPSGWSTLTNTNDDPYHPWFWFDPSQ